MTQQVYNEPSDKLLVEAIINNDHDAFKNLYYKYFEMLIRFAWYRLHSTETARDLVQEVFCRVWIKRKNLDPDKSIKAYLYTSLNNSIINYSKLKSSKASSINDLKSEKNLDNKNYQDFNIDMQTVLQKLPEKLKAVFILSRIEGYKYSEIADICGISVKAVEKRITKTFNILRKIFSE